MGVVVGCRKRKGSSKEAEVVTEFPQQPPTDTVAAQPTGQSSPTQQSQAEMEARRSAWTRSTRSWMLNGLRMQQPLSYQMQAVCPS